MIDVAANPDLHAQTYRTTSVLLSGLDIQSVFSVGHKFVTAHGFCCMFTGKLCVTTVCNNCECVCLYVCTVYVCVKWRKACRLTCTVFNVLLQCLLDAINVAIVKMITAKKYINVNNDTATTNII
jgi:hypothetical protein